MNAIDAIDATDTDANANAEATADTTGGSFGPVTVGSFAVCGYCGCPAEGAQCPCCGEAP